MKRRFLFILFCIFIIIRTLFAEESQEELKRYLNDMNKIVIEVEEAMRNLSMKILPVKNAVGQITASIEKFEILEPPSIFSENHNSMLSAFKSMRDGLKLLSEGEREKSVRLVREGAAYFKNAAIRIRTTAEQEGLIPVRPRRSEATKPILPPQTPAPIAGASPTPSPHIASPSIENDFIARAAKSSSGIKLLDIPDSASIPQTPLANVAPLQKVDLPTLLTTVGEITSVKEWDDYFTIRLKDDFGNKLELDVKPQLCAIMKGNKIITISEIKKGLVSYVLYTKSGDRNQAKFISILKSEDANIFRKSIEPGTTDSTILKNPTQ